MKNKVESLEKFKNVDEYADLEQIYHSTKTVGIHKTGYHSIRLMKWMACYDE